MRVVILGAGPTGLGAAYRLRQLGHRDFCVFDMADKVGGLAASVRDPAGFLWDLGGHILDARYGYFEQLLQDAVTGAWNVRQRRTVVRLGCLEVDYPLQHHLDQLPAADRERCITGLPADTEEAASVERVLFEEWLLAKFGQPLCDLFMFPYNRKVWAYDLSTLDACWVRARVPSGRPPSSSRRRSSGRSGVAGSEWGPTTLRSPHRGGTGAIWEGVATTIGRENVSLGKRAAAIDVFARRVLFDDGTYAEYDFLISSISLDHLLRLIVEVEPSAGALAGPFVHSTSYIVGVGLDGPPPAGLRGRSWMYFPYADCPFYLSCQCVQQLLGRSRPAPWSILVTAYRDFGAGGWLRQVCRNRGRDRSGIASHRPSASGRPNRVGLGRAA